MIREAKESGSAKARDRDPGSHGIGIREAKGSGSGKQSDRDGLEPCSGQDRVQCLNSFNRLLFIFHTRHVEVFLLVLSLLGE